MQRICLFQVAESTVFSLFNSHVCKFRGVKALAAAALEVVLTAEGFRQPVIVEVGNPFQECKI